MNDIRSKDNQFINMWKVKRADKAHILPESNQSKNQTRYFYYYKIFSDCFPTAHAGMAASNLTKWQREYWAWPLFRNTFLQARKEHNNNSLTCQTCLSRWQSNTIHNASNTISRNGLMEKRWTKYHPEKISNTQWILIQTNSILKDKVKLTSWSAEHQPAWSIRLFGNLELRLLQLSLCENKTDTHTNNKQTNTKTNTHGLWALRSQCIKQLQDNSKIWRN